MKYPLLLVLFFLGCSSPEKYRTKQPKNYSSFSHLEQKKPQPFESTFLNPVVGSEQLKGRKTNRSTFQKGPLQSAAYLWFLAYQNTLSRLDGSTCGFSPTCSAFALDSLSELGPLGLGVAFGRLHKNHLDHDFYHLDVASRRLLDPISNYTFWLKTPKADNFSAHQDPAHAWFQHVSFVNE